MDSLDDLLLQEILQPSTVDKLDPSKILELCRRINQRKIGGGRRAVRAAKYSLFAKDPVVQLHALTLLDALASNCATIFHDFASEHVVDDIVNIISHRLTPVANQEIANKLATRLAQHIRLPLVFKQQFERRSSKGAYASPTFSNALDFQQTCRKSVQGLLNDLTSSPQNEALHLQKWLEGFSNKLLNRADGVTAQVRGLLESTGAMELELHNVFNSFRGLSSSQFVENLVNEEDELEITNEDVKKPEQGMSSQSYEDDIVPRYKEAVTSAWRIYETHIWKPSTQISSSRTQVPHIIGTEDFMRDNSCGLAEDRSFGFEALDSESDAERDEAAEITEARISPEEEWSGSESEIGGFKPSVSAALDFKTMLEAALRSPYIPQKADAFPSKRTTTQHFDSNLVPTIQGSMASTKIATAITTTEDQIQRSVSKQGHGALQSGNSSEPGSEDQVSTLLKVVSKPIPPQQAEIQKLKNWKEPSSEEETTTMILNDVLRDFRTSMMSGGLFDDENEDGDLFGSKSARTYDTSGDKGTRIEKHERSVNDDILVSESKALSSPKKPSFPHSDETFSKRSYTHVHDSLFANESTSSLSLKDTLSFLKKGMFEDDDDEPGNTDLFGPSNGFEKIDGTNFGDSAGNFKGMSSSNNSSVDAKALVDEISERAGVARGASYEAAASTEAGLVIKKPDTGSTNKNIEGLSRTLSSLESLSETRREVEDVNPVAVAQVVAHEKSDLERLHGYADNRDRFLNIKTTHILDEEKVLNAKSDDDAASWSSASSTSDTLNLGKNSAEAFLANGFKSEEPQQQIGNMEILSEHPTRQVEEVTDSSHSQFLTNVVEQQYRDESGVVKPPMNSPREKTNEELQNISSNWSRKLNSLQENLSLQCTMSPPQQRSSKTQSDISVDDAFKEKTPQTQRPPLQATSQDMNSLHHATMSRPRGPKRHVPTSTPPLLMTSTQGDVGNSPEDGARDPSPHFVVQESDSIGKTMAFSKTNDTVLHLPFENTNTGALSNEGVADDTLSMYKGCTKSSKKTMEMGFADKCKDRKSQAAPSNTHLIEDEDSEDGPFGSLEGMVYPSSSSTSHILESKLSQGLTGSDKGSAKEDFVKGPEGALGKVPGETLKHQLSPRECFRRSLFDDDDEDDDNNVFS